MYRVLRPGGHLLVNVAALKFLTGNHSVLGGEMRRYDRQELRAHLIRTGGAGRRRTDTKFTLLPIVAGIRQAQSFPAKPVNLTLASALAVESVALRFLDMPLGSSLLALAYKP